MKSSYTTLMQSKFFSPAFNSAIFDGPVRIYFAQFHEALALKIYFMIQQKLPTEMARTKEISKATGRNILIMVYPTEESFDFSFDGAAPGHLAKEDWEDDVVIGLRGPLDDEYLDGVIETLQNAMQTWQPLDSSVGRASVAEL